MTLSRTISRAARQALCSLLAMGLGACALSRGATDTAPESSKTPPPPPAQHVALFAGIGVPIEGTAQVGKWVYIAWNQPCNALGCADQYRVTWTINGAAQQVRTLTGLRDSVQVTVPLPPGTATVSGSVVAVRRGIPSPARASATLTLRQDDAAPPAVDSVKIDTLPPALDVGVHAITVGQAVWSDSGPHAVTLVANRAATVRAWVAGDPVAVPRLTLTAVQASGQRDTLVVTRATAVGTAASPIGASYVAQLPAALVQPETRIDAAVRVLDGNAANNTASHALAVQRVPPIRVHLVPVVNVGRTAVITDAMRRDARDWAMRLWPLEAVEVTEHPAPFVSTADTLKSNDSNFAWLTTLSEINALRNTLGAPGWTHVVGVLPVTFSSGIAGYAYVPGRAMVVWDKGSWGRVYSHELGHNLGRRHVAACGSGNTDSNYPYPSGQVGVHGWNGALVTPTSHTDIMGYCSTQHVSDYTWRNAMSYRGPAAAAAFAAFFAPAPTRTVAVHAILTGTTVALRAAVETATPDAPAPGPITVALFAGDSLVRETSVRASEIDHAPAQLLSAWIPTDAAVTRVVLTRRDGGLPLRTEVAL